MRKASTALTKLIAVLLIAALVFTTVSCSFGNELEQSGSEYIEQIVNPDRALFYGETITIAVRYPFFVHPLALNYMDANPGVTIEVIRHAAGEFEPPTDWGQVRMEVGTQLMAGSAPTLIDSILVDPLDPRQAIFFFDWSKLMDADPDFYQDDWFMNVFHAFAIDGRLPLFPIYINYSPIVANRTIPGLVEALAEYAEGITLSELLQLNRTFSERYPQYHFEETFSSAWIMWYNSEHFIDFETGRVEFGETFVNLVTYADSIATPHFNDAWRDMGSMFRGVWSSPREQTKSERYLFHLDNNQNYRYFLDFDGDIHLFAGMTPLTNDHGELLIESIDSFLLNANATPIEKAIAWDFLMFTMQPENFRVGQFNSHSSYLQPPNRNLFHHLIREQLDGDFGNNLHGEYIYPWFLGTVHEAIDGAIARMTAFAEMPMRATSTHPRIIDEIIADNMGLFYAGLLSAEQTAQNLQNQITLVLMEMDRW